MPVQAKVPFSAAPHDYFFLTSFSGEYLQIVNTVQEWTGLCLPSNIAPLPVDSGCWPSALSFLWTQSLLFIFSLQRDKPKHIVLGTTDTVLGVCLQAILPLPRHSGIAVWFLQEYTDRNRHHSRCRWALSHGWALETAAADTVVCVKSCCLYCEVITETW